MLFLHDIQNFDNPIGWMLELLCLTSSMYQLNIPHSHAHVNSGNKLKRKQFLWKVQ